MINNLKVDEAAIEHYNETSKSLAVSGDIKEVQELKSEEVLVPYSKILSIEGFKDDLYTPESRENFDGVFFATDTEVDLFCKNFEIDRDKTYRNNLPGFVHTYGVADNVSQILDYYDEYKKKFSIDLDDCIIAANCIYKKYQPSNGGWRWHKWGKYLGKYKISHEYIYDEDIEMVLVWELLFLKPKA